MSWHAPNKGALPIPYECDSYICTYDYLTSKWAFVTIVIGPGTEKQHCLVKWYLKVHKYLESPIKMFKRKF